MEGVRATLIKKRETLQMSRNQLAKVSGVSYNLVKKFEDGEDISAVHIIKIAAGLGYTLERETLAPETLAKFTPYKLPKGVNAGDKKWKWTILGPSKRDKFKHAWVLCECECEKHTLRYVDWGRLSQNKSTSCGCDRKEKIAAAAKAAKADTSLQYKGESLAGTLFNDGMLLALNTPPRLHANHWEWLCQCQVHDVPPKYFRISKLKSGEIKSCGCHGGSESEDTTYLGGKRLGFVKVRYETRKSKRGEERLVKCAVCGKTKWVLSSYLRKHKGISCYCTPRKLEGMTIGKYRVVDKTERKNNAGLPEILCDKEDGSQVWVSKEKILHTLATEMKAGRHIAAKSQNVVAKKPATLDKPKKEMKKPVNISNMDGQRYGFFDIIKSGEDEEGKPAYQARCVLCQRTEYIQPKWVLTHEATTCHNGCCPNLYGIAVKVGNDILTITDEDRENENKVWEVLCKTEFGGNKWVDNEVLMRAVADKFCALRLRFLGTTERPK